MKLKIFSIALISLIFLACEGKKQVEVGAITEIDPSEVVEVATNMAPGFSFKSISGEQVSLEDLRGKFVYVDIWATWCRPCLMQIPSLKEVEEKYKGTDIEFVSISVDNERDKGKWEKMVSEKQLGGLQLYAGSDADFNKNYQISSIPRFLLIGKEGELIDGNAPRPLDHQTNGVNQGLISVLDGLIKE